MQLISLQDAVGKKRRARRYMFTAVTASVVLLGAFHQPVLTSLARRLVVEEERPHFDRIVVYNGEGRFDETAARLRAGIADGVLLLEEEPIRPIRLGILPSSIAVSRQALTARGISDSAIGDVRGGYRDDREAARQLGTWLQGHADLHVLFLCRRLESGDWRRTFDAELEPSIAARVFVHGLPQRSFDEARWWRSRSGIRAVSLAYVGRLYELWGDRERPLREPWDPDAFVAALRAGRS